MKRIITISIATVVMLCSTMVASAQKTGFYWGPKVGTNFSKFQDIEGGKCTGFDLGLVMGADIAFIGFEVGAGYSNVKSGDLITNNISVPVIAKVFVLGGLNVFGGPKMDFLITEKIRTADGVLALKENTLETTSVSGIVGIGYQFIMGLNLGLSYNVGPLRTKEEYKNSLSSITDSKFTKHSFAVSAGWRF